VLVLSIANFESLQVQHGLLLTDMLLEGFIGKAKIILHPANIVSYNGDGSITVLVPHAETDGRWRSSQPRRSIFLNVRIFPVL
jgi:hypothetical protein